MTKKLAPEGEASATGDEGIIGQEDATIIEVKGGTEEGGGGGGGGGGGVGYSCPEKEKQVVLESLHLQLPGIQQTAPSEDKGSNSNLVRQPLSQESLAKAAAHLLEGRSLDDPVAAKDDLRAYAYEGEGSSAGSLSSSLSGWLLLGGFLCLYSVQLKIVKKKTWYYDEALNTEQAEKQEQTEGEGSGKVGQGPFPGTSYPGGWIQGK
ncbi:uncharacterized protein LOC135221360 [Macrobrachium nipponense]|uniref:uncharacterized protein LOC135221360 n=1 Tax=Macrobrachium nipponense TaxID=159736 RepID=UPI0030C81815